MMLYVNLILPFLLHFPSSFKSVHPLDTFVYTYTIQNYSMSITLFRIPDQNDGNYHHMTNILATGLYAFCVCVQLFVSLNLILTRSILCLTLYYLCCLITSITTAYNHHFFYILSTHRSCRVPISCTLKAFPLLFIISITITHKYGTSKVAVDA